MKKNSANEEAAATAVNDESEILSRLSERVERAVGMIQELRRERDTLRARIDELETRVGDVDTLEEENTRFQKLRHQYASLLPKIPHVGPRADVQQT